ncbi:unnamed protein product [Camellia sinensis]
MVFGPSDAIQFVHKLLKYPVYFAFEDDDINVVLADVKKNDVTGQPATATTGGWCKMWNLRCQLHEMDHKYVDGEALMNLSRTLLTSIKSHIGGGVTPSDFISCLLRDFTKVQGRKGTSDFEAAHKNSILWKEIGFAVSSIFKNFRGCCTMLGPMQIEVKRAEEKRTDTDENMLTMFDILKSKRRVKLESLILNRKSFAQTVENLFALSFLVKDGRVIMAVDEKGSHLVSPTNAADAPSVMSGEVAYSHFVFRYDFKDWKACLLPTPKGASCANYARCMSQILQNLTNMQAVVFGKPEHSLPTGSSELAVNHIDSKLVMVAGVVIGFQRHPLRPYLDYVAYLYQRMDPLPEQERFEGFLTVALAISRAVSKALMDRVPYEEASMIIIVSCVLMVVGAGRGPLVRASLQAAEETGRKLRVYAVDKNPNAIVTLHGMNDRVVPPSMTDFVQRLLPRGHGA